MAGLGSPVVPEVYINIAMSVKHTPLRSESGGLSGLLLAIALLGIDSHHDMSIGFEGLGSTRQSVRIPAAARSSLMIRTLEAISESKMNSFASEALMQWNKGLDVRL